MTTEFHLRDVVTWFGHRAMVIGKTYREPLTYDVRFMQGNEPVIRNGVAADDLELVEQ